MKWLNQLLLVALGLVAVGSVPTGAASAARVRDVCIAAPTGGGSFNTFVFRDVEPLSPGRAVTLRGVYYVTSTRKLSPLDGSAAMASDGTVRIGFFVHSTAVSINDFTISGIVDANFAGTLNYDNDGDFLPNGTLAAASADCATLNIP
jgi:hypothetical protein